MDTNVLIEFIHGNNQVIDHALKVGFASCYISVISLHELYFGAYHAQKKYFNQEVRRISKLQTAFDVLPLPKAPNGYGKIKEHLMKQGRIVDEFDMIIGGQALDNELIVVTDNTKHFADMPDIKSENWCK